MYTVLESIATGNPPIRFAQSLAASIVQRIESLPAPLRRRIPLIYERSSIDFRYTCVEDHVRDTSGCAGTRRSSWKGRTGDTRRFLLLRAFRMQEKAAGVGFDFPERDGAWEKVEEEIREYRTLAESGAPAQEKEAEFGDMLFALVNYARFTGVNPENALRRTNEKFGRRFRHIERRLAEHGQSMADVDLAEMDRYWDEAKLLERQSR